MPFAELRSKLLATRELRQKKLDESLGSTDQTLIQLALNIPGAQKCPPGSERLAAWAENRLRAEFPGLTRLHLATDSLGHWAVYQTDDKPEEAKLRCCRIEESQPFGRLLDLDVFSPAGEQIDRELLRLAQRVCLLCSDSAKDCMRTNRHESWEINEYVYQLLESVPD